MISVLTWNCAGNSPPENFDIQNELFNNDFQLSDIYIVGLQEIVPLNTSQVVIGKDKKRALIWENIILNSLNQNKLGYKYI